MSTGNSDGKQRVLITASRSWLSLELAEIWSYRDLLRTLAARDLKVRYKQTALGVFWVIAQPLMAAGIFSFVFGSVAKFAAPGGVPYFIYAFAGLFGWNVFSNTLGRASGTLVGNAHLVQKVYFPRLILPLSSVASTLIDFVVTSVLLVVLLGLFWRFDAAALVIVPACVVLMLMLAMGIGSFATALSVKYRDVRYVLPVLTQLLLWASPVAYALEEVPAEYHSIYFLNPLAAIIHTFKVGVLGVGDVPWGWLGYSSAVCVAVFVGGVLMFKRLEGDFADVI